MVDIFCMCRTCGALCDPIAHADRGGLCARCAFPMRVTRATFTLTVDADPFKKAIDKACAAWADDNPEVPQ